MSILIDFFGSSPWAGGLSYYAKPSLRNSWGGPFNGQHGRVTIFKELLKTLPIKAIIETGTFRGTTTEFFSDTGLPVFTVEADDFWYGFARARFRRNPNVRLFHGDSRAHLPRIINTLSASAVYFFYLDAHWGGDLPLHEEVDLIAKGSPGGVIMIDDFAVPGDSGYYFDDYGGCNVLKLDYLKELIAQHSLAAYFPKLSAAEETGARRGCIVLAGKGLADPIGGILGLRQLPIESQ